MRIGHIAPTLEGASGVATFVRELDASLRAKGVESSVAVDGRCSGRVDVLHLHGLWLKMYHQVAKWASETLGQCFGGAHDREGRCNFFTFPIAMALRLW